MNNAIILVPCQQLRLGLHGAKRPPVPGLVVVADGPGTAAVCTGWTAPMAVLAVATIELAEIVMVGTAAGAATGVVVTVAGATAVPW